LAAAAGVLETDADGATAGRRAAQVAAAIDSGWGPAGWAAVADIFPPGH